MARVVDNPVLAFRLARAIMSDISLYNQDKVVEGITNDTLFTLLKEELEEGREHFHRRVSAAVAGRDHLYDRAIVDVLVRQAGRIPSAIW